ncbi:MAG: phosphohistidine phosphatase SixA [Verrucomicrobiota bacterium]|jgi:phosphohistidine phosphatase
MKLYFLRHADALAGVDDAQRPLSSTGREQARELARCLRRSGVIFDLAFTSPLVRAQQTLAIVLDITNEKQPLLPQETPALLNATDADAFADWLAQLPDAGHVLLVGHEPTLSARVRRMLGLEREESLPLSKGAVACVKTADQRIGTLKFLLTPKSLGVGSKGQS